MSTSSCGSLAIGDDCGSLVTGDNCRVDVSRIRHSGERLVIGDRCEVGVTGIPLGQYCQISAAAMSTKYNNVFTNDIRGAVRGRVLITIRRDRGRYSRELFRFRWQKYTYLLSPYGIRSLYRCLSVPETGLDSSDWKLSAWKIPIFVSLVESRESNMPRRGHKDRRHNTSQ